MQREEPYLGLTCSRQWQRCHLLRGGFTGGAWSSSARVVRCWVKSRNERNPRPVLPACCGGNSRGTAGVNSEEGGDDVRSSCPLRPGLHACYNGRYSGMRHGDMERIPENRSQFGLESATRLHEAESLVIADQQRRGECVPGPCTHRPSSHESGQHPKPVA